MHRSVVSSPCLVAFGGDRNLRLFFATGIDAEGLRNRAVTGDACDKLPCAERCERDSPRTTHGGDRRRRQQRSSSRDSEILFRATDVAPETSRRGWMARIVYFARNHVTRTDSGIIGSHRVRMKINIGVGGRARIGSRHLPIDSASHRGALTPDRIVDGEIHRSTLRPDAASAHNPYDFPAWTFTTSPTRRAD